LQTFVEFEVYASDPAHGKVTEGTNFRVLRRRYILELRLHVTLSIASAGATHVRRDRRSHGLCRHHRLRRCALAGSEVGVIANRDHRRPVRNASRSPAPTLGRGVEGPAASAPRRPFILFGSLRGIDFE
jgi:hypothetical protein